MCHADAGIHITILRKQCHHIRFLFELDFHYNYFTLLDSLAIDTLNPRRLVGSVRAQQAPDLCSLYISLCQFTTI